MKIPISKLHPNIGQIEGLPKNPRLIADAKFALLKKSIQDDPEMLTLRELLVFPFEKEYVIIGGNMRLLALTELGYEAADCKVIDPKTPVEKLRAYIIKDNLEYGMTDWNVIESDWDKNELDEWGLDGLGNTDYKENSDEDNEIDVNSLDEPMKIVLKYNEQEYLELQDKIRETQVNIERVFYKAIMKHEI